MRRTLVPALALAAGLAASALGAATAHAAPPTPLHYLALGDSYPAGVGVADPSTQAYPALLARRAPRVELTNNADSGATTAGVLTQITPGHDLITLTVGANDLHWGPVLVGCLNGPATCQAPNLTAMGAGVLDDIGTAHAANPGAKIFVTGYPELFDARAAATTTCDIGPSPVAPTQQLVVSGAAAAEVDLLVDGVNRTIQGAADMAAQSGADVTYVDASAAFEHHRLCDDTPWLHDLTTRTAFHPTAAGQRAYAGAINQAGFREAVTSPVAAGRN